MNKNKEILDKWCKSNNLSYHDLLSICFFPRKSMDGFLYCGAASLSLCYQFFKVTGLDIFMLSEKDKHDVESRIKVKNSREYWENKICDKFFADWKKDGSLPAPKFRLSTNKNLYQNKTTLIEVIKKDLFLFDKKNDSNINLDSEEKVEQMNSINKTVMTFFEGILKFPDEELLSFIKGNKKDLRKLASIMNMLIDEDPIGSIRKMNAVKKQLNQF